MSGLFLYLILPSLPFQLPSISLAIPLTYGRACSRSCSLVTPTLGLRSAYATEV